MKYRRPDEIIEPRSRPALWQSVAVRLALVILVAAVYWPAAKFGYVAFDDELYGYENGHVQQGLTLANARWALTASHALNWHPLTWLSLMLDVTVLGDRPEPHHLVNIVLHALNVLLLLSVIRAMTGAFWRSALVAGLLAVHPMHVESVAWISERKDVLSMLFWLLTMRAYVWYVRWPGLWRYMVVGGLMAMGLMAKPMVVTLPCALLLLDFWPLRRAPVPGLTRDFWRRAGILLLEKMPLLLGSAVVVPVTMYIQHRGGTLVEGHWLSIPERLEMVSLGYVQYLFKLVWPSNLALIYPNLMQIGYEQWPAWHAFTAAGLLAFITLVACLLVRRAPYLLVGWLWYLGTMVPVIGFVQIGRHVIADRYAYVPFIGLYVIVAWGGAEAMSCVRGRAAPVVRVTAATGLLAALAIVAHRQVRLWKDSITLFQHTLAVTRNNWAIHNNLASELEKMGRAGEALAHIQTAREIVDDQVAFIHRREGEILARAGRRFEAEQAYRRALAIDPSDPRAHTHLGLVLVQTGRTDEGLPHLRRGVELEASSGEAHQLLALCLAHAGRHDEAITMVRKAMQLDPEMAAQWQRVLEAITAGSAMDIHGRQPGQHE